jgi:hypothetical protein
VLLSKVKYLLAGYTLKSEIISEFSLLSTTNGPKITKFSVVEFVSTILLFYVFARLGGMLELFYFCGAMTLTVKLTLPC